MKLAVVIWHDAWLEANQELTEADIPNSPATQVTAGFLVRRDKKGVTLAMEYSADDGNFRTVTFIPAAMVKKVRLIK